MSKSEPPNAIPDVSEGDTLTVRTTEKNMDSRTLTVLETHDSGDIILSGYGTQYALSEIPKTHKKNRVVLSWKSYPTGRRVTGVEVDDE